MNEQTNIGSLTQELQTIECRGMVKLYPGVTALDGLNFSGRLGEVHAILGENAAGKSTFIKILGGSVIPDEGTIEFCRKQLKIKSPSEAQSCGISIAYQELSLIAHLTVEQNIWLHLVKHNKFGILSDNELRNRTYELFEKLNSPIINPDCRVNTLNYAQRQIIEIVKSLASDPKIVVFDEATSTLPGS